MTRVLYFFQSPSTGPDNDNDDIKDFYHGKLSKMDDNVLATTGFECKDYGTNDYLVIDHISGIRLQMKLPTYSNKVKYRIERSIDRLKVYTSGCGPDGKYGNLIACRKR